MVGVLTVLLLSVAACTSSSATATASPSPSPPESASPSPNPSPSGETQSPPASTPPTTTGSGLAVTSLAFHNGEVGIGYLAVSLGASGGTRPYTWSVSGGQFPPGLTLSTDGTVTGTNSSSGHFSFTVKVSDSTGATATSPAGFTVFTPLAVSQPCASQCTVGVGCSVCGGFGSASGGLPPYGYTVVGGFVPPSMSLSGLRLVGGFPGSPLGSFSVTVQVSDQFGASHNVIGNWYVYNAAILSSNGDCVDRFSNGTCTTTLSYSGGSNTSEPKLRVLSVTCNCTQASLPPIWNATVKGGTVTISAGTGASCVNYSDTVTLVLTDTSACAATDSNPVAINVGLFNCG